MSLSYRKSKRSPYFIPFLILLAAIAVSYAYLSPARKQKGEQPQTYTPHKTLYKTILSNEDTDELIGFELHTDTNVYTHCSNGTTHEYNAIVKNLNPATDDYKHLCRKVITDIIDTCGVTQNIKVNVFDSFEAYCLYYKEREDFTAGFTNSGFISSHLVASYEEGFYYDNEYAELVFYPMASGVRTEQSSL
jgi:hypothetical protein